MEQRLYQFALIVSAIFNLAIATNMLVGNRKYSKYPVYLRARILTIIWLLAFAAGYFLHAACLFRYNTPAIATALTATYFHIGAICFNWGYTSLLNPNYLTKSVIISNLLVFIVGVVAYWTVSTTWKFEPFYATLSTIVFFAYAAYGITVFYRTYNLVAYRMMKMSIGNVSSFVKWLQMCCDLIIFFGVGGVALTGIFPDKAWPYIVLSVFSPLMFGYISFSLSRYGAIIQDAPLLNTYNVRRT
ncbi:MAG: hypothetical protein K6E35_08670 [Bacteroidales bacterium]|nr:hypothetical protein [Bacteroidales bacterium]